LLDLNGKKSRILLWTYLNRHFWRALFHKEKVSVEEINVGFDYSQLIFKKQIDAEWAFRQTAGITLPSKGVQVNVIQPADYGCDK